MTESVYAYNNVTAEQKHVCLGLSEAELLAHVHGDPTDLMTYAARGELSRRILAETSVDAVLGSEL